MSDVVKCFVCQSQSSSAGGTNVNGQKKRRKTNNKDNYHNLDNCTWRIFCNYFYPPPLIGLVDQQQQSNSSDLNGELVKTPIFCPNCSQTISQLSSLHEQLELIRAQLNKIVAQVSLNFVQTEENNDEDNQNNSCKNDDGIPPLKRKRFESSLTKQDDDDVIYSMRKCIRRRYQPLVLVDKTNANLSTSKIKFSHLPNSNENAEIGGCEFSPSSSPFHDLDLDLSIPIKQEIQDIDISTFDDNNSDDPLEIENYDISSNNCAAVNEIESINVKTVREKKTKKKLQKNKTSTKKVKIKPLVVENEEEEKNNVDEEEEEQNEESENLGSESDSEYEPESEKPKSKTPKKKEREKRSYVCTGTRRPGRPKNAIPKDPYVRKYEKDVDLGENIFALYGKWKYAKKENEEGEMRHYCLTCFNKPCLLNRHSLIHHVKKKHDTERPVCDTCNKKFSSVEKLENHKATSECKELVKKRRTKRVDADNFTYDEIYHIQRVRESHGIFFKCLTCGALRKSIAMLKTHLREIHIDQGKFVCEQCGRAFCSKAKLKRHSESHSDTKNFICELCGGFFKTQREMSSHREKHRSEPFVCECGRKFVYRKGLRTHRKDANHPAPPPEPPEFFIPKQCEMCGREFHSDKHFTAHTALCQGRVRQYCELCGGTFLQLEIHQKLKCKQTLVNQNNDNNNEDSIEKDEL